MKKKLISLALSAAMLFAGFSISAFAEEPLTGSEPEPAAAEAVEEEENSLFRKPAAEQTPETTEGEAKDGADKLKKAYFAVRGWSKDGVPSEDALKKLGIRKGNQ